MLLLTLLGSPATAKSRFLRGNGQPLYGQAADPSIQQRKKINGSLGFDLQARPPLTCLPSFSSPTPFILC